MKNKCHKTLIFLIITVIYFFMITCRETLIQRLFSFVDNAFRIYSHYNLWKADFWSHLTSVNPLGSANTFLLLFLYICGSTDNIKTSFKTMCCFVKQSLHDNINNISCVLQNILCLFVLAFNLHLSQHVLWMMSSFSKTLLFRCWTRQQQPF